MEAGERGSNRAPEPDTEVDAMKKTSMLAEPEEETPLDEIALDYRVHAVRPIMHAGDVEFEGQTVRGEIGGIEVELQAVLAQRHGTLTLRFVGAEAERWREVFHPEDVVELAVRKPPG
jgi:hypothetical protein